MHGYDCAIEILIYGSDSPRNGSNIKRPEVVTNCPRTEVAVKLHFITKMIVNLHGLLRNRGKESLPTYDSFCKAQISGDDELFTYLYPIPDDNIIISRMRNADHGEFKLAAFFHANKAIASPSFLFAFVTWRHSFDFGKDLI